MKKSTKFLIVVGIILLVFALGLIFGSCENCSNKLEAKLVTPELVVDEVIAEDLAVMEGKTFDWFETCVLMKDYLDEETDGSVAEVVNVFQTVTETDKSFDTKVFKFQHFADGTFASDSVHGFWIEDIPLVDSLIKVPYDSAFALIQKVNLPKPHTRNAILRNPLGPRAVNPQWVFGNIKEQLWVDAVSGEIKLSNPAFEGSFGMPLGEWP